MSHQEIAETFLGSLPRSTTAATPLYHCFHGTSSSASIGRSNAAPSSSSRPPYQAAFYPARPPAHPPLRMSPSEVLHQEDQDRHHEDPHLHQHQY
jgi:hypothetical protein